MFTRKLSGIGCSGIRRRLLDCASLPMPASYNRAPLFRPVRGSGRVSVRVLLAAGLSCVGLAGCGEDQATAPTAAGPALSDATVSALATEVRQLTASRNIGALARPAPV